MSKRLLPADAYDTLELSALAYGGIGAGKVWDTDNEPPYCVLGHRSFVVVTPEDEDEWLALGQRASTPFLTGIQNDDAVRRINHRKGADEDARVSFAEWCAELGVERGS